jgi:crotonobetainyl-CoA:carnitine CoA-transferase CaiB-like acyl-CoA transferase
MTLPYAGIRVLDFTQFQQGPVGTQMLGDYGAEVIKIERPGSGDGFRGNQQPEGKVNGVAGYGAAFVACNRNKKSLALDLKAPEAKLIIHALVRRSDVVASNFRPGVMDKLGFGFAELSVINPRIICAYATGYGLDGPDRDTPGQDMMAQARAGLVRGDPPHTAGYNLADQFGGLLFAQGIMLALAAREKTGRGQVVDSNLLNTALVADNLGLTAHLNRNSVPAKPTPASGRRKGPNPTYALYQCCDGRWVHIIDAFRDHPLQRQCRALGIAESVANDPRFADVHNLSWNDYQELHGKLSSAIAQLTPDEVVERFRAQDMMAVQIQGHAEVERDPQVVHNHMILEAQHPQAGSMRVVSWPISLSETPASLRFAPPLLGEHSRSILCELLSYTDPIIDDLAARGVIK